MESAPPTPSSCKCRMCNADAIIFHKDRLREYYQCPLCQLVFVPIEFMLSEEDEKAVYDLHENVSGDAGYEKFLSRAATPVIEYFSRSTEEQRGEKVRKGLDFGCGPCTVLASMLSASPHHYHVDSYDLFYFPENAHFLERIGYYDFITATEVVEHLADPLMIIRTLWTCLKPRGGILVIMTKRVEGTIERFRNWHYIRDPTHVSFFHERTFAWLADALPTTNEACEVKFIGPDVVVLRKTDARSAQHQE
ncbi:hypothetical protein ABL78_3981 [Leptomonas seymouri]|uniref:Methyltransferase-like protein n=1 Tax=Leptomonas seymouri TaxID=5684 RepID=A0A0N1PDF1_LEPSE|nr:hypothetical protein ABL78_3981 [Leptomonas seymouri]|eukprot:KPI86935.1 hypothetical protein ABL78_3981 [Leptomonas seymouri]